MDIIRMARDLAKAIQQDERYQRLIKAGAANDKNEKLQSMIEEFNSLRQEINNELMKGSGKGQEKLASCDQKLKSLYGEIMETPEMAEYNAAKGELETLLNFIGQLMSAAANGEDPETFEVRESSCGGTCSSCGGCQ